MGTINIIKTDYNWNGKLSSRNKTNYIVMHHRAGNGDAKSIHSQHLKQGWVGIGYHFYVRKDGSIYSGRPINTVGAHVSGFNSYSVGVCFEGNFSAFDKKMSEAQMKSAKEIISYLKQIYPSAKVVKHSDLAPTACPGENFPFEEVLNTSPLLVNADEITWELNHRYFKIDDYEGFIKILNDAKTKNSPMYWGYYKLVNHLQKP